MNIYLRGLIAVVLGLALTIWIAAPAFPLETSESRVSFLLGSLLCSGLIGCFMAIPEILK